jgi:hypothetical protein
MLDPIMLDEIMLDPIERAMLGRAHMHRQLPNMVSAANKKGPIAGATFQEATVWWDVRKGDARFRSGGQNGSGSDAENQ